METIHIKLNGLSPLLMHNPATMKVTKEELKKRRQEFDPEVEAAESRYLLDGKLYVPAIAVRNSILGGAKGYKIGRFSAIPILASALEIAAETFLLLRNGQTLSGESYSIDTRRAVIQKAGITRARARIELPWQLEAVFAFNPDLASVAQVKEVASNAGRVVGLLDYRPEKKVGLPGWFGKYEVTGIWSE